MNQRLFAAVNPSHAMHVQEIKRRLTGQQLGTKSSRRSADKPLKKRSSSACQPLVVPPFDLHRIHFIRASEETSRALVFVSLEVEWKAVLWPNWAAPICPAPVPPRPPRLAALCLAPPQLASARLAPSRPNRRAFPRPVARGMSGFWSRQVFYCCMLYSLISLKSLHLQSIY